MSRPRSSTRSSTPARGARPAARAGGGRGVYVASPKSDIYVALLGVALGAMILAILLLTMVWRNYDFKVGV